MIDSSMHETETVAFRMMLHAGQADEYRRRHDLIWPELRDALRAAGVIDYRIFLDRDTNHLFAVLERRREHGLEQLRTSELMRRWWNMMSDIMETNADLSPTEATLEPMFTLD